MAVQGVIPLRSFSSKLSANRPKDIGFQGMVHANPESKYMKTIETWLKRKRELQLDAWGRYPSPLVESHTRPLADLIDKLCPASAHQYPPNWSTESVVARLINQIWMSQCTSDEFAELFRGMSETELEACAKSFSFDECIQRSYLNEILEAHSNSGEVEKGFLRPTNEGLDLGQYNFALEQAE